MPDGEHCERGGDAGNKFVIRRIVVIIAATVSASFMVLPQNPAGAASTSGEFTEAIARKQVVTSPQTTGPSGGALSWGLDRIDQRNPVNATTAYSFSEDGTGVKAYVLDSGVNASHPEFGSRVIDGWSYRGSTTALTSYRNALASNAADPNTGIEACPNDGSHATNPLTFDAPASVDSADKGRTDNDGHGTHVAGIIGGETTGVAKNLSIVPVRALDSCGNGTTTMILEGLAWILNNHGLGEKAILNLSIGFDSSVSSVDTAITNIMNEGVVVVAAAGNSAASACGTTPAATLGTISVGSSTISDIESSFSNYGQCVDLFSPGSAIKSTFPYLSGATNTYQVLSGTSMAAPFVSGVVARFLQTLPTGPTNFLTGPTAAWTWIKTHATCGAITYASHPDGYRTSNRLLATVDAPTIAPCSPTLPSVTAASKSVAVEWNESLSGNGGAVTYAVTSNPGAHSCTTSSNTCTVTGLTNGITYTFSIVASNSAGASSALTIAGAPVGPIDPVVPNVPTAVSASVASKSVTLTWAAVTSALPVTYVVTDSNNSIVCTTTSTSCVVAGLTNGAEYTFSVASQTSAGNSPSSVKVVTRPGFTVLKTTVAKKSKTPLTWFVKTISNGKKTWSESGPCSISSSRLVAPTKAGKCVLTLKVAKTSKYPAMSTKVTIAVK